MLLYEYKSVWSGGEKQNVKSHTSSPNHLHKECPTAYSPIRIFNCIFYFVFVKVEMSPSSSFLAMGLWRESDVMAHTQCALFIYRPEMVAESVRLMTLFGIPVWKGRGLELGQSQGNDLHNLQSSLPGLALGVTNIN